MAMLLPSGALATDSMLKDISSRAGLAVSLPLIRYLDTMRWMEWKPAVPVLKVHTLLLPDLTQPGVFRLPSHSEPGLLHVS